ncbi:protein ImuB [Alteromonadaceae bacterium 2753L.S.0a.02]|nr:protein ImuB [Alteromonadaceae bacterium 2753L.S.0a.02]
MAQRPSPIWLAIRLPHLPLEVFGFNARQAEAAIIVQKQRVLSATQNALASGVELDMPAATAQMLIDCQLVERDLALEQAAIRQLTDALYQYTPYLQPFTPSTFQQAGVVAEVSRSLKLFHGMAELQQLMRDTLKQIGYDFLLGTGHTELCAWLLSWLPEAYSQLSITKKNFIEQLNRLPVSLLCQCHSSAVAAHKLRAHVEELQHSGFDFFVDITRQIDKQSTASLRKRWGNDFCNFLSQLYDIDHHLQQATLFSRPLPQYHPEQIFYDSVQFDYPLKSIEQLLQPMDYLLQNLTRYLIAKQQQCQKIEWLFFDIYHNKQIIEVYSSQQQNQSELLLQLSRIQLEAKTLAFEVDTVELICRHTFSHLPDTQALAFCEADNNRSKIENNFAIVTAKLKARLGDTALFGIATGDSHIPEQSHNKVTLSAQNSHTIQEQALPRPSWLFDSPHHIVEKQQQLQWRGNVTLLHGPERIEGNWWQQQTARDYFIAQRDDGLRLWVFYDLQASRWYVHGVFG